VLVTLGTTASLRFRLAACPDRAHRHIISDRPTVIFSSRTLRMHWSLSLRGEEFLIGDRPHTTGKADDPDVLESEHACAVVARCVGHPIAMAGLRTWYAHMFGTVQLDRREDHEVIRYVDLAIRHKRLWLWRRPLLSAGVAAGGASKGGSGSASSHSSSSSSSRSSWFSGEPRTPRRSRQSLSFRTLSLSQSVAFDAPVAVSKPPALSAFAAVAPLSYYEVLVQDELESGIAGLTIQLDTPAGTSMLTTDASGTVRVDSVPPGTGSARIVSTKEELSETLAALADRPKRRIPVPDEGTLLALTPAQLDTVVIFPDALTQRIMILSRTDVVWGSVVDRWGDLVLLSDESVPCRLYADDATSVLQLASTGAGASALLGLPQSGVDSDKRSEDDATKPTRLAIDIDALHEALFAEDFDTVNAVVDRACTDPPLAAPPRDFPPPIAEAALFVAQMALLALKGDFDSLVVPDKEI
jgi:hypothetical protein